MRLLPFIIVLLPNIAYANIISDTISRVGTTLNPITGNSTTALGLVQSFVGVIVKFIPTINIIAAIIIVVGGLLLIVANEENDSTRLKNIVIGTIVGLLIINLATFIADAMIGWQGGGVNIIESEVDGFLNWMSYFVGLLVIASILATGIRAIGSLGSEDGIASMRQAIISLIIGVLFIVGRYQFRDAFVGNNTNTISVNPSPIVDILAKMASAALTALFVIAVTIIIYLGLRLIFSLGNDEDLTKVRSMLVRMIIGLIIIAISYWLAIALAGGA